MIDLKAKIEFKPGTASKTADAMVKKMLKALDPEELYIIQDYTLTQTISEVTFDAEVDEDVKP